MFLLSLAILPKLSGLHFYVHVQKLDTICQRISLLWDLNEVLKGVQYKAFRTCS